jgi:ribosome-binding protein aMBF1 (putative translation factor)
VRQASILALPMGVRRRGPPVRKVRSPLRPRVRRSPRRNPPPVGDTYARLGEHLRALRQSRGLSQAALGEPYFTRAHVSAIETGRLAPAIKTLRHFAHQLGVPLRDLIPPDL